MSVSTKLSSRFQFPGCLIESHFYARKTKQSSAELLSNANGNVMLQHVWVLQSCCHQVAGTNFSRGGHCWAVHTSCLWYSNRRISTETNWQVFDQRGDTALGVRPFRDDILLKTQRTTGPVDPKVRGWRLIFFNTPTLPSSIACCVAIYTN